MVHHVIVSVAAIPGRGRCRRLEIRFDQRRVNPEAARDPQRDRENARRGTNPDGMLIGYGQHVADPAAAGLMPQLVKKGSVLIFQMHYTTNGVAATDRTSIGLVFAKEPVEYATSSRARAR